MNPFIVKKVFDGQVGGHLDEVWGVIFHMCLKTMKTEIFENMKDQGTYKIIAD